MRFLMCRPTFFDVAYVINPWMSGNIHAVAQGRAAYQWRSLYEHLSSLGHVELIDPQPDVPDMPFTANAAVVLAETAIISRFRFPERQQEEPHFARWFEAAGFRVQRMPDTIPFEGAGDALLDRAASRLWLGYGHRSEHAAAAYLRRWLDVEVVPLQLADTRFYHLDTCFCPLEGGFLLYFAPAFTPAARACIEALVPAERRYSVSEADALSFACNAVNVGTTVLLNQASPQLQQQLSAWGLRLIQTPLSEFLKAGGAAKCLTLRLNEPRLQPALVAA